MADRSQWRLVALLLAAAVLLAVLSSRGGNRSALDPRASSFRATPQGTLGLFLLLEELGIPAERRVSPLVQGTPLSGALVLLEPSEALSPFEVDALVRWVDAGGRLIYAAGPDDGLLQALGLAVEPVAGDTLGGPRDATASVRGTHPLLSGVERVAGFEFAFADSSRSLRSGGAVPLLAVDEQRVSAVLLPRGDGQVLALSDAAPLTNQSLRSGGVALLFARAAEEFAAAGGGAIQFDEYHHGFRGGGSPASALTSFLVDTPAGWMTLQLVISCAGLLLLLGSRFGTAIPPAPARRRSPLEHLEALAQAYQAGGARNRARHLFLVGAARRLGRPPPAAGEEEDRLGVSLSAPTPTSAIAEGHETTTRAKGKRMDLITLAGQVDRLVAERKRS